MARGSPILVVTRPLDAGRAFAAEVRQALGRPVDMILSPLIRIKPCADVAPIGPCGGVILTSAQAAPMVRRLGLPSGLTAWCVGARTADAARKEGLMAEDAGGDADDLVAMILARRPDGPLLHLRGEVSRGDVAKRLGAGGIACDELVAYRQIAQSLSAQASAAMQGDRPVVLPVFSPRTGAVLAGQGPFAASIHAIAMSDAVARTLGDAGFAGIEVVDKPEGRRMVTATSARLGRLADGAA